jgi:hypothetical protein
MLVSIFVLGRVELHHLFLSSFCKPVEKYTPSMGYLKFGPTLILPQTPPTCTVANNAAAQANFEGTISYEICGSGNLTARKGAMAMQPRGFERERSEGTGNDLLLPFVGTYVLGYEILEPGIIQRPRPISESCAVGWVQAEYLKAAVVLVLKLALVLQAASSFLSSDVRI